VGGPRKSLELEGATRADAHLSDDFQQPQTDCFGLSFTLLCAGKSRRRSASNSPEGMPHHLSNWSPDMCRLKGLLHDFAT
jgi:hypothetical protein